MKFTHFIIFPLIFLACNKGLKNSYVLSNLPTKRIALSGPIGVLWQTHLKADLNQFFIVNDSLLLIGDSNGGITTLNLRSGIKSDRYWIPNKRPIRLYDASNKILYFSSETQKEIWAWDLVNADKVWKKKFTIDYDEMQLVDSTLFFKSDSSLAKVKANNGEIILSNNFDVQHTTGFIYNDGIFYVCTQNGVLKRFDANLTKVDELKLNMEMVESITQINKSILFYNTLGHVKMYSMDAHSIYYENEYGSTIFSSPFHAHDQIIVPFANGKVSSYSIQNDSLLWSFSLKSLLNLNIMLDEENIIIPYARGIIVALD